MELELLVYGWIARQWLGFVDWLTRARPGISWTLGPRLEDFDASGAEIED